MTRRSTGLDYCSLTEGGEALRVRRLTDLALPAAGRLDARQMVTIREAEEFETFRMAQRHALTAVGEGADEVTLALYRAEMAAAASTLSAAVSRATALRSLFTKAVGWGVGAMVITPHGWQAAVAALGGITTEVAAERLISESAAGRRALRHHYATLSQPD